MCPQGHNLIKNKGLLDYSLFQKIIDDIVTIPDFNPIIGLHMNGEPLINKRLSDMVFYASQKNLYTQIHSNGVLLDKQMAKNLVESNLSELTFSFEGENRIRYEQIRINSDYNTVMQNIKYFLSIRKSTKVIIEVLKFRNQDVLEISEDFKKLFPDVEFKSYFASDWHGTVDKPELKEEQIFEKKPAICKTAETVFAISWDGLVHPCCLDFNNDLIIGDMNNQSILEVWEGNLRKQLLKKMALDLYDQFSLCRQCGAPYTLTTKERIIDKGMMND